MPFSLVSLCALLISSLAIAGEPPPTSTLLRTAIFVKDRPATVTFFKDVMGYDDGGTSPVEYAAEALGLPADAKVTLTMLKSKDGAGLSIMGVESAQFGPLQRPPGILNASGDVMLVHQVTGIASIHARAVAGKYTVLMAPRPSKTGKSMQMFLRDPNGIRIEIYELIDAGK